MKTRTVHGLLAVALVTACRPAEVPPEEEGDRAARLAAELEARGFEVARGDVELFTIEDCAFTIDVLGNCLGNNPTAPYAIPAAPPWPDEFVDENLTDVFGPTPAGTRSVYRMGERCGRCCSTRRRPRAGS